MRAWFVKDLTLMIEWAKCIPQMKQLLLNDKVRLVSGNKHCELLCFHEVFVLTFVTLHFILMILCA